MVQTCAVPLATQDNGCTRLLQAERHSGALNDSDVGTLAVSFPIFCTCCCSEHVGQIEEVHRLL